ncbi:hypothetical protein UPYG_G00087010 [Umbra pygmaea]|uniref:Uncharacterized protein n=1 Tax=Umbra pygmaea TaxID=75934 RepID=A0ABD0XF99_UMBPY
MTDPIIDFFDDPSLFVSELDGLAEDGFSSGPSLVDELNLDAGFEPLQVEPMGAGKHTGMMPASTSSQQDLVYGQQMVHFPGMKAQNAVGQAFPGSEGVSGGGGQMRAAQHAQFQNPMGQAAHSNGLFSNSSPMWGNQDQNGNVYHSMPQQQQQQQQQPHLHQQQPLHIQKHHLRPPPQAQSCQQQLQQLQQQLLNQQRHNFPFHQANQSPAHQTQQLTIGGTQFHSRAVTNSGALAKAYLKTQSDSLGGAPPQPGGYQLLQGPQGAFPRVGPQDTSLPFSMQSSSPMRHAQTLPSCSVGSVTAYPTSQYAFPGQGVSALPGLNQPLSSTPVSMTSTTTAPLPSLVPELSLSGGGCTFSSTPEMAHQQQPQQVPVSQVEDECPFRALRCSRQTQGNYDSSEMFGQAMSCYPSAASQLVPEQPRCFGSNLEVTRPPAGTGNSNGYATLEDSLAGLHGGVVARGGGFEGLDAPDLLADELLPQLEAAFSQHHHAPWSNGGDGSNAEEFQEEERMVQNNSISVDYDIQVSPVSS